MENKELKVGDEIYRYEFLYGRLYKYSTVFTVTKVNTAKYTVKRLPSDSPEYINKNDIDKVTTYGVVNSNSTDIEYIKKLFIEHYNKMIECKQTEIDIYQQKIDTIESIEEFKFNE